MTKQQEIKKLIKEKRRDNKILLFFGILGSCLLFLSFFQIIKFTIINNIIGFIGIIFIVGLSNILRNKRDIKYLEASL